MRKLSPSIILKIRQLGTLETSTFLDRKSDWKFPWAGGLDFYFAEHFMQNGENGPCSVLFQLESDSAGI